MRIPQHGESGQVLQLPSETGFGHHINYTVISGAASISDGQLSLEGVGPVTLRATLVDMEGFLPSETTRTVLAEAILLDLSRNAADGSLRLGWWLESDLLETAPSLDGPWVPVPEARSPYHPAESGPVRFWNGVMGDGDWGDPCLKPQDQPTLIRLRPLIFLKCLSPRLPINSG